MNALLIGYVDQGLTGSNRDRPGFPSYLEKAQAQVLLARAEGFAALERARCETAALRNLANAARLCAGNPALLQLRLLQQLSRGPAQTVVIGMPPVGTIGSAGPVTDGTDSNR